jgi:hypothetical protein
MELLLVILAGIVVWSVAKNVSVIVLLGQQALAQGTVRGYWGAFFEHCIEGNYSAFASLVVAVPVFVYLAIATPFLARRRERFILAAVHLLHEHMERGLSLAESTSEARVSLVSRGMGTKQADAVLDAYLGADSGERRLAKKQYWLSFARSLVW